MAGAAIEAPALLGLYWVVGRPCGVQTQPTAALAEGTMTETVRRAGVPK